MGAFFFFLGVEDQRDTTEEGSDEPKDGGSDAVAGTAAASVASTGLSSLLR